MVLRDTIRDFEKKVLVEALAGGASWEEAKELLPDVDPAALDRGFKAWAEKQAAVTPPPPVPVPAPVVAAAPVPAPLKKREKRAAAQKPTS